MPIGVFHDDCILRNVSRSKARPNTPELQRFSIQTHERSSAEVL